jgi:hypothetical protein
MKITHIIKTAAFLLALIIIVVVSFASGARWATTSSTNAQLLFNISMAKAIREGSPTVALQLAEQLSSNNVNLLKNYQFPTGEFHIVYNIASLPFCKAKLLRDSREEASRYVSLYPEARFDTQVVTYLRNNFASTSN